MTKYAEQLNQKANIRFGLSAVLIIIATIFMIWPSYKQLVKVRADIVESDKKILNTRTMLAEERDQYSLLKAAYSIRMTTDKEVITSILPDSTNETDIVRELEKKAVELAGKDKSFFLDTISFSKPSSIRDTDYLALGLKISAVGTREKLTSFLRYLEKTGNVLDKDMPSRFIDVQTINLSAKDRGTSAEINKEVTMNILSNAYVLPSIENIKK
jgi:hypothetical protein